MKFSEKTGKARATVKGRCKQGVKPLFSSCGKSAGKVGKCRKKPASFPGFSPHIPKPFAEKVCEKSICLTRALSIRRPFSAFSENQFWVYRRARPITRGKMSVNRIIPNFRAELS
jgi:hypothetical protein